MYEDSSWGSKIRKIHPFWGGIRIFRKIRTTGTPAEAAGIRGKLKNRSKKSVSSIHFLDLHV